MDLTLQNGALMMRLQGVQEDTVSQALITKTSSHPQWLEYGEGELLHRLEVVSSLIDVGEGFTCPAIALAKADPLPRAGGRKARPYIKFIGSRRRGGIY